MEERDADRREHRTPGHSGLFIRSATCSPANLIKMRHRGHKRDPTTLCCHRLVRVGSRIILMGIMASVADVCLAAVYECRDPVGRSVLTNRPVGLQSCRSIIKEAESVPPSPASKAPQQPGAALTPNESAAAIPNHAPEASIPLPILDPSDGPDSAPRPHSSPCRQGVNPLNPLIATPCAQPDPPPQPQPNVLDGEPGMSR